MESNETAVDLSEKKDGEAKKSTENCKFVEAPASPDQEKTSESSAAAAEPAANEKPEIRDPRLRHKLASQTKPAKAEPEPEPVKPPHRSLVIGSSRLVSVFENMSDLQDRRNIEIARTMRTNRQNAAAKAAALAKSSESKKTTGAESVDTQNRSKNTDRDSRPTVNQPPDLGKPAKIVPQDSQMAAGDYGQSGVGAWGWNDQQNYNWYNQYPYPNANWGAQPPYYPGSDASDRPPRGPADPSREPIDPRGPVDQRGPVDPRGQVDPGDRLIREGR